MALYKIAWKKSAIKELKKIEKAELINILAQVERLVNNPHPPGSKKLRGSQHTYRIVSAIIELFIRLVPLFSPLKLSEFAIAAKLTKGPSFVKTNLMYYHPFTLSAATSKALG